MAEEEQSFREFCVDQVERLSQFRQYEFMSQSAQRDFRNWLETRCRTKPRIIALMNAAIEMEQMPTISDLNRLYVELFAAPANREPELNDEERGKRAAFLRDWYAQEAAEAEERRKKRRQLADGTADRVVEILANAGVQE